MQLYVEVSTAAGSLENLVSVFPLHNTCLAFNYWSTQSL